MLLAPDIFPAEIGHAISKSERRGVIPRGRGDLLLADILSTAPALHSSLGLTQDAFAIASMLRIPFYDCLYVALAQRERCALLTADQRLVSALRPQFANIIELDELS